ncbi:DevA family ABC transporter ATP-binding protein [Lyngbya confervoides]|uniref:DevA family ABC transporter ATP-binding protein n=1 Tax=Lyngbya confervoides BDU141951 TaxID=1574623 RepID=A0ABD4T5Z8_9CYAN|nr:DevA family ABC transporter ATP-binding protein [Lyngbya confervoides]MCM1984137.1 DevA family ABC transporter ATP-binding protein [Lyngbya confervoides BDU141951]
MGQEPVIAIDHVSHYFGRGRLRKQILFQVCETIYPGEIVIMTGPSGSGKTTLLTLIGALRSTQEGSLQVLGQQLYRASRNQLVPVRRNIGYIFQAHNLLHSLTARQNVQMSLDLHSKIEAGSARQRSQQMLEAVGLGEWVNSYPHHLSGGQKQRVAIARALVSRPKIVLADEPTAALDKHSGREVVELMQSLAKQQGCTILIVTHDNRILDVADRIIQMEDGHLSSKALS